MKKIIEILEKVQPGHDYLNINDYIEENIFDSLDIIQIVSLIEGEYNVSIDGLDITPEYFKNLDSIIKLVKKYRGVL